MDPNLQDLLKRYNEGSASPEEKRQVEAWYLSIGEKPQLIDQEILLAHFSEGKHEIQQLYKTKRIRPVWKNIAAAAVVLVFIAGAYFMRGVDTASDSQLVAKDSIQPGEETAIFSMANGEELDLKAMVAGATLHQGGVEIVKLATGGIQINQTGADELQPSTIKTPKGGEFDITLPDGSLVKLNADSELKLLAGYNKADRRIDLSGEAFFDVQKSSKPFVVRTAKQKVTVLGTQFNIKAYASELETTTKLLRGSVKVSSNVSGKEVLMKPGDQIVNKNDELLLSSKEKQQIDWVDKEFVFNEKTAEELMNDIARWYNLEVEFENDELKTKRFTGRIERYSKLTKVIAVLEATEVLNFEIEGRKIIVK
ncbi:FecR family protein [Sphingobacterium yanglingense]|uniref:FecR family protein n=1 Tax=Sphingobacterium yanglingense TaxID=1437280 RepID=A0A4R6WDM0_9SPHI|nr:FecR family protein [Sphingobacterium yanglingense]TDQ75437.1 FecR family protein [Sphingobacterium yanglingense]